MSVKLTLEDFHTFYLSSFMASNLQIMRDAEAKRFLEEIESFAKKLLAVTKKAIYNELYDVYHAANGRKSQEVIKQIYGSVTEFKKACKSGNVPLTCAAQIFRKGDWADSFGPPWAEITRSAGFIEDQLPLTPKTIENFMVQVDHLIDLWHNSGRYLQDYGGLNFDLVEFLDVKSQDFTAEDFDRASPFIKGLYERWGTGRNLIKSGRK